MYSNRGVSIVTSRRRDKVTKTVSGFVHRYNAAANARVVADGYVRGSDA
jgi:hypothetical protein